MCLVQKRKKPTNQPTIPFDKNENESTKRTWYELFGAAAATAAQTQRACYNPRFMCECVHL